MSGVTVHRLGRVEYADGLDLQRRFQEARRANRVGDTLMLLHHPPVLTLGRGAKRANVLASEARLAELGVEVHETDRGGDVTYHGPGQIVGYPLLHLPPGQQDVRKYVRKIEEVMIRTCAHFGIAAHREEKWPGVWTGGRKIAALGVHLSRWYTRHGFALNVAPDLGHFELIVPCGIREAGVTSMARELRRDIAVAEVEPVVAEKFSEVFELPMLQPEQPPLEVVSVVVRQGPKTLTLLRTPQDGGFWQVVTGTLEKGESPEAAALREAREETGLTIERLRPLNYEYSFTLHGARLVHERAYAAEGTGEVTLTEHRAYEWLDRDAALARMPFPGLREAVRRSYA
ncbi:MAG: lipoyl(octanoyl) transferase LipB [Archangiaceae bacterium]|nr:lipoyl(octanoyl) transferase LipB [Archangiaceae bacterium]